MVETARLIVVVVFDADPETGVLVVAGEPMQFDAPEKAVKAAQALAGRHAGVIAFSRAAKPDLGEYGEPEVLFQAGEIGDLE